MCQYWVSQKELPNFKYLCLLEKRLHNALAIKLSQNNGV